MILASGLIILTVVVIFIFILSKVFDSKPEKVNKATPTPTVEMTNLVPASEIVNNPAVYEGYKLEVESNITDWVTNRSFTLNASSTKKGVFGSSGTSKKQLLVIAKYPFALPQDSEDANLGLGEKSKVLVKGQIQIMNREELEYALGGDLDESEIRLDNNNIDDWKEGPVLLLDSIIIIDTDKKS